MLNIVKSVLADVSSVGPSSPHPNNKNSTGLPAVDCRKTADVWMLVEALFTLAVELYRLCGAGGGRISILLVWDGGLWPWFGSFYSVSESKECVRKAKVVLRQACNFRPSVWNSWNMPQDREVVFKSQQNTRDMNSGNPIIYNVSLITHERYLNYFKTSKWIVHLSSAEWSEA